MAHIACFNGHSLWNGDGKPTVWAFPVSFFRHFQDTHPSCVLGTDEYIAIYDCYEEQPHKELDCWYCDECQCLAVFWGLYPEVRMDYTMHRGDPPITEQETQGWEIVLAVRDPWLDDFTSFCEGKRPYDALLEYDFPFRCKVSPDERTILVYDGDGTYRFRFDLVSKIELNPQSKLS